MIGGSGGGSGGSGVGDSDDGDGDSDDGSGSGSGSDATKPFAISLEEGGLTTDVCCFEANPLGGHVTLLTPTFTLGGVSAADITPEMESVIADSLAGVLAPHGFSPRDVEVIDVEDSVDGVKVTMDLHGPEGTPTEDVIEELDLFVTGSGGGGIGGGPETLTTILEAAGLTTEVCCFVVPDAGDVVILITITFTLGGVSSDDITLEMEATIEASIAGVVEPYGFPPKDVEVTRFEGARGATYQTSLWYRPWSARFLTKSSALGAARRPVWIAIVCSARWTSLAMPFASPQT